MFNVCIGMMEMLVVAEGDLDGDGGRNGVNARTPLVEGCLQCRRNILAYRTLQVEPGAGVRCFVTASYTCRLKICFLTSFSCFNKESIKVIDYSTALLEG